MKSTSVSVFWFRRDLRWDDNTGLYEALNGPDPVLPLFIFDREILDDLEDRNDARVEFIRSVLQEMNRSLTEKGSSILFRYGTPLDIWKSLLQEYTIARVYTNRDYEPYARERDEAVNALLTAHDIPFYTFKDHVIMEQEDVMKDNGDPYVVFTPYSRKWKEQLTRSHLETRPSALRYSNFVERDKEDAPTLEEMNFTPTDIPVPTPSVTDHTLENYKAKRDYPAEDGTSRLGIHLRFGTVSIRKIVTRAQEKSDTFLNELIWREFYQMILWHFPQVVDHNFHRKYDALNWRNDKKEFERWCEGNTGYPIVDAGMRQLNKTGYMHNRIRMVVASFLTKHLLIDWRWGEAYFAKKLLDYELASNNGGWQWAAGTGTDAQPYFRIFNPYSQTDKFDADREYIRKWVPEVDQEEYPDPMVDHKEARERALAIYKKAVG
jgi:deoxyribodipyrimidine photo-lyase